jgi:prepilin-type processing-associated H-X9-DG protein
MSYITAIATSNPEHKIPQPDIAEFMLKAMLFTNGEARKLKTIFRSSGIDYRHSVIPDYGRIENFTFFPKDLNDTFPSTKQRLGVFREHALPLSVEATQKVLSAAVKPNDITHLIVVCCTGMYAPGLDIELIKALNLSPMVHRTAINFMGCYAAFNALKIADAFCRSDKSSKVLVVCTELCSLHFQREATDDNLLANALFADGSAAVLVEGESDSSLKLELEAFHNDLSVNGENDMAWSIGDLGFEMKLSSYVPDIIRSGIRQLTDSLLAKLPNGKPGINHYAIHPGGKRILEVIEEELDIPKGKNDAAYHVLKNYGNMSSATVLFVLNQLVKEFTFKNVGENILSFAFGPGLTMESMMLKIKSV